MNDKINHQVKLAARPMGLPKRNDWEFTEAPIPEPAEGQVLVQVLYVSIDPAMRGWMSDSKSYLPPVAIGEVMRAGTVGRVLSSRNPKFKEGDYVTGSQGAQAYGISDGSDLMKISPELAPLPTYLGALGMPGMTAYFGLLDIGDPKEGETVLVSAAAGAVGALVGQIAKIKGCRVVGIAGGEAKCRYVLDELGFDAVIDYKSQELTPYLKKYCPEGIDIYFDNVGGETLDAALARLRRNARVVLCGAISQYNANELQGPKNYLSLLINRGRMEGFIVFDYKSRYGEGFKAVARWIKEGKVKTREHIVDGLEYFPETLLKLFDGSNFGKLILKV